MTRAYPSGSSSAGVIIIAMRRGRACRWARAASGHAAAPPTREMNSRRLIAAPYQGGTLPHGVMIGLLCITAFGDQCLSWVTSGSAGHVDGLPRARPLYPGDRTRAGPTGWGRPWANA